MKLIKTALFAASLFVLAGSYASAQEPMVATDASTSLTANGTVVSSGTTSVVVRLDDGTERTFAVDNRSSVPSSLAAGARVNVSYASETGGYRALTVTTTTLPAVTTDNTAPVDGTTDNSTLPSTGSALPLVAAAGFIALTAALLMGSALRRA
jgi:hypothetical protein